MTTVTIDILNEKALNLLRDLELLKLIRLRKEGAYNNTWYIPDNEITNNNIPQNPAYQ